MRRSLQVQCLVAAVILVSLQRLLCFMLSLAKHVALDLSLFQKHILNWYDIKVLFQVWCFLFWRFCISCFLPYFGNLILNSVLLDLHFLSVSPLLWLFNLPHLPLCEFGLCVSPFLAAISLYQVCCGLCLCSCLLRVTSNSITLFSLRASFFIHSAFWFLVLDLLFRL